MQDNYSLNQDNSFTGSNFIDVDNDHGGNLEAAIASANSGDVIQLGSNTYYTDGIFIDKNITLDGQEGSVINGNGTSGTIMTLSSGASGATVKDLEITNGNNGLYGNNATNLTIENIDVHNIGLNQTDRQGKNDTAIALQGADGAKILNSSIRDIGRKGVGFGDTNNAEVNGLTVQNINLAGEHVQSHDAAGVKLYNTHNVAVKNSYFSDINAFNIWNDTASSTVIEGNVLKNVGEDFLAPSFNTNVNIAGIYDEKSSNTTVNQNSGNAVDRFLVFDATEFSSQSINFGENDFSAYEMGTQDYWVNEEAEKLIAVTENANDANFSSVSDAYYGQANIG